MEWVWTPVNQVFHDLIGGAVISCSPSYRLTEVRHLLSEMTVVRNHLSGMTGDHMAVDLQ
jgi:hypothetical protein